VVDFADGGFQRSLRRNDATDEEEHIDSKFIHEINPPGTLMKK
jgi:hypothetical protein